MNTGFAFDPKKNPRWAAGFNSGMFFGAGAPKIDFPKPESTSSTDGFTSQQFIADLKAAGVDVSKLDPNQLANTILTGQVINRATQKTSPEEYEKLLRMQSQVRAEEAERAQKFGKESLAITSMYNQINNLPGTIASAFGGAGERQLMSNLYGQIPGIVSETYRTFPRTQIQPVSYSVPATRYFGAG